MKNIDIKIESMTIDSWIEVARIYEGRNASGTSKQNCRR